MSQVGATEVARSILPGHIPATYVLLSLSASIAMPVIPQLLASNVAGFGGCLNLQLAKRLMESSLTACDFRPVEMKVNDARNASAGERHPRTHQSGASHEMVGLGSSVKIKQSPAPTFRVGTEYDDDDDDLGGPGQDSRVTNGSDSPAPKLTYAEFAAMRSSGGNA